MYCAGNGTFWQVFFYNNYNSFHLDFDIIFKEKWVNYASFMFDLFCSFTSYLLKFLNKKSHKFKVFFNLEAILYFYLLIFWFCSGQFTECPCNFQSHKLVLIDNILNSFLGRAYFPGPKWVRAEPTLRNNSGSVPWFLYRWIIK